MGKIEWFYVPAYLVALLWVAFVGSVIHTWWQNRTALKRENKKLAEKFGSANF